MLTFGTELKATILLPTLSSCSREIIPRITFDPSPAAKAGREIEQNNRLKKNSRPMRSIDYTKIALHAKPYHYYYNYYDHK